MIPCGAVHWNEPTLTCRRSKGHRGGHVYDDLPVSTVDEAEAVIHLAATYFSALGAVAMIRPLTLAEQAALQRQGVSCARCPLPATRRVVGPGAFRLCDEHAEETRRNLEAR